MSSAEGHWAQWAWIGFGLATCMVSGRAAAEPGYVPRADARIHAGTTTHLHSVRYGTGGDAVIVVNGGPGVSHDHLIPLRRIADDTGLAVVFYDQRGAGLSSKPSRTSAYQMGDYVRDLDRVRTGWSYDRVDLVGHSWGALVAVAYAARHPEHVRSLTLIDPGWPTREDLMSSFGRIAARTESLEAAGVLHVPAPDLEADDCTAWLLQTARVLQADPSVLAGGDEGTTCSVMPRYRTFAALGPFDLRPELRRLAVPVHIIQGALDPYGDTAAAYANELGSVRVTYLPDCGHRPMHECPAPFYSVLERVLTGFQER